MGKHKVVMVVGCVCLHTHSEIPFSLKKEWNYDIWDNLDELWKHFAKWNKPDTEDMILPIWGA